VFTDSDHIYTYFAATYDQIVKRMPNWQKWIGSVLPYLQGPRVLDISFGTGYLITQIARNFEAYGVDLNAEMVSITRENLVAHRLHARLQRADTHSLPYRANTFDSIINTMAFNGYQDCLRALSEMRRTLLPRGRLLIVDVNPPADGNPAGMALARRWETRLDSNLDMGSLFGQLGFTFEDHDIGGFGSVHLYIATKVGK
jgi:ubiquinone/menaquinone biosynthesis C-methylase UbiE